MERPAQETQTRRPTMFINRHVKEISCTLEWISMSVRM